MERMCPWWMGYGLASPLRRLSLNPEKLLASFVTQGMTILEPGPGMGFFTLPLARMAGAAGRVVAVDVQQKMLDVLGRRARRAGIADRIEIRLAGSGGLDVADLADRVDFALAFAVVHEVPDPGLFFRQVRAAMRRGGRVLFAEPQGHVTPSAFAASLEAAARAGLVVRAAPVVRGSHAAVLEKA